MIQCNFIYNDLLIMCLFQNQFTTSVFNKLYYLRYNIVTFGFFFVSFLLFVDSFLEIMDALDLHHMN